MTRRLADRLVDELSHVAARYACAPPVTDRPGAPTHDGTPDTGAPESRPPAGTDHALAAALVVCARSLVDAHQAARALNPPIEPWHPPRSLGKRHTTTDDHGKVHPHWQPDPDDPGLTTPSHDIVAAIARRLAKIVHWADSTGQPLGDIAAHIQRAKNALDRLSIGQRPSTGPVCDNYTRGCTNDPRPGRNYCTPCQRHKERYGEHRTVPSPC